MQATEITQVRTRTAATAPPTVEERVSGTIMAAFFAGSTLVGLWSVAAMVGGLVTAGGPGALAKGFAQALLGI